ncbi:MAG: hypothetical protein Q8Q49_02345 [bacterium]|nr:hypothetical protein [bacterium]
MDRVRRKVRKNKHQQRKRKTVLFRFIIFSCIFIFALILANSVSGGILGNARVLGDKILLAHDGDGLNDQPKNTGTEEGHEDRQLTDDTKVLCVGEGQRTYKTTYRECKKIDEELNQPLEFEIIEMTKIPSPTFSFDRTSDTVHVEIPDMTETEDPNETENETQNEASLPNDSLIDTTRTSPLPQLPIEVLTKDGTQTIDLNTKGIKIRMEREDDHIIVKATQEDGTEVELQQEDALFHIEERLAIDRIKIVPTSATEFLIQRNSSAAVTNFPLSWDLTSNTLIITTPAGTKEVPVLPDQAVDKLISSHVLDHITIPQSIKTNENVNLGTVVDITTLTEQDGEPIYQVTGITSQKLFGLFPVAFEKTVDVSGTTGDVTGTNESFINRFVDLLSV